MNKLKGENKMKNIQTYDYLKKIAYMHNISNEAIIQIYEKNEEARREINEKFQQTQNGDPEYWIPQVESVIVGYSIKRVV